MRADRRRCDGPALGSDGPDGDRWHRPAHVRAAPLPSERYWVQTRGGGVRGERERRRISTLRKLTAGPGQGDAGARYVRRSHIRGPDAGTYRDPTLALRLARLAMATQPLGSVCPIQPQPELLSRGPSIGRHAYLPPKRTPLLHPNRWVCFLSVSEGGLEPPPSVKRTRPST